jgi:hypothetical protein
MREEAGWVDSKTVFENSCLLLMLRKKFLAYNVLQETYCMVFKCKTKEIDHIP